MLVLPLDKKKDKKRAKQKTENTTRSQEQEAWTKEKVARSKDKEARSNEKEARSRGSLERLLPPRSRRGERSWHNWSLLLGTVDSQCCEH